MNLLISFGPSRAYIDDVRYITNNSSGFMGYSLVLEALKRGFSVRAVVGGSNLKPPKQIDSWVEIEEHQQLKNQMFKNFDWSDVVIMAAAVCDFIPKARFKGKIPRASGGFNLKLESSQSIIGALAKHSIRKNKVLIGFSLESKDFIAKAEQKRAANNLDALFAFSLKCNPFGNKPCSTAIVLPGRVERLPFLSKTALAAYMIDAVEYALSLRSAKKGCQKQVARR
ncbi:MAG TPA: hypothetical protein ENN78_02505 [Candidatus Omnitrophica bacterium]|mgnify:CR=1 FL=1|nr:hypothetical protein [Candidatus Omnitrophota bacterium]